MQQTTSQTRGQKTLKKQWLSIYNNQAKQSKGGIMRGNWIQLVYSKNDDALFLRLNTEQRNLCIGLDRWGKVEIFPISHIPEDFQSPNYHGTKQIPISNTGAIRLLNAVPLQNQGSTFNRFFDQADVRTAHTLMNAASVTLVDNEYNPYRQGGWLGQYHYNPTPKIEYDLNPRIAIVQQYQYYSALKPETSTNITKETLDSNIVNFIKNAQKNNVVDRQLDQILHPEQKKLPTNTANNHLPTQYLIPKILEELAEQHNNDHLTPDQLIKGMR